MKKINFSIMGFLFLVFFCQGILHAQPSNAHRSDEKKPTQTNLSAYLKNAVTTSSLLLNKEKINYTAEAGTLPLVNKKEQDTTARMSYVAYFKNGEKASNRPITFLYNGGPGSSSLWLHLGSFGPKIVEINGTEHMGGAPYKLKENENSLLDVSDLIFIDMPGTGFGRILEGKESDYYSVDNDAAAFAQFIQTFITKYNRWNSPKFLFGESYGTLRSAVVANYLQSRHNIDVNGIILLSQILDYANSVDGPKRSPGLNNPYFLALPTYAATAWYHHKLPSQHQDLRAFLDEVEEFSLTAYAQALNRGASLSEAEFNETAQKLHQYTGLSVDYIKEANLRIDGGEFRQQLLKDDGEIPGRLGTRFSGPIMDPLAQKAYGDPQSDAISSAYVALLNDYMRNDLKFGEGFNYRVSAYGRMNWKSEHRGSSGAVNVINDLANTMKKNPKLQVLLTTGYYDLATPYFEGVYELQQLPISKNLFKNNVHFAFYESGHMVYLHIPSLEKMSQDVRNFIQTNS